MSVQVQIATAIIAALKASSALTDQLTSYASSPAVFTHVPQDLKAYPYVILYESALEGNDNDCHLGFDGVINIHSWSDQRDVAIIGNIQKSIYDVLHHADLTMSGYVPFELHQEFETILRDPDGITLHVVQRFRILIQADN